MLTDAASRQGPSRGNHLAKPSKPASAYSRRSQTPSRSTSVAFCSTWGALGALLRSPECGSVHRVTIISAYTKPHRPATEAIRNRLAFAPVGGARFLTGGGGRRERLRGGSEELRHVQEAGQLSIQVLSSTLNPSKDAIAEEIIHESYWNFLVPFPTET